MKCDKLQRHSVRGEMFNGEEICGGFAYYDAEQVDAAIAELKEKVKFCSDFELAARKDIEEMRGQHQMLKQFGHYNLSPVPGKMINHEVRQYVSYNVVCMIIKHLESENADLKQKLSEKDKEIESLKASHYAESVDAGMRERRLKRALWLARAERAKTIAKIYSKEAELILLREHYPSGCGFCNIMNNKWRKVERKCRAKAEQYK